MTSSNRTRMTWVDETTLGTTPTTPRMRTARFTGEDLKYKPVFNESEELRDDRMASDPTKVNETNGGSINGELSYPVPGSPLASWFRSMMGAEWRDSPWRDNDGTADSVITAATAASDTFTVTDNSSGAFVTGHLVRATGFTQAGNNGLFRAEAGSSATALVVPAAPGLTDEAAPPAAARLKVIGFEGAAGDITAAAAGLASTALDFTTLGLAVGQWIKVGGAADASTFAFLVTAGAVSRRAAWARITAITATALTLDNLPPFWAVDAGTGKTIQVFFGDQIKNGVSVFGGTVERGFMGQAVPTYIVQRGMAVDDAEFELMTEDKAKFKFGFKGITGSQSTTSLDVTPDAATTNPVMAAGVDVGRVSENGACLSSPNWMKSLKIAVNNNLRPIDGLKCGEDIGPVDIHNGSFDVSIDAPTYFGSNALLEKLFAGTPTNINARIAKGGQAIIFAIPRLTFTDGSPSAGKKNESVMVPLSGSASKDDLTSAHFIVDRFEYWV